MFDCRFTLRNTGLLAIALLFVVPAAFGQMQQPDTTQTLSSSDVSDEQVRQAAEIMVALQTQGRQMQMQMRKDMKRKFGNPQDLDSTEKENMRRELKRQQRQMQQKQMKMMKKKSSEVGMPPETFRRVMRSAQQDSTLQKRLQTAMKKQAKQRQPQQGQGPPGNDAN